MPSSEEVYSIVGYVNMAIRMVLVYFVKDLKWRIYCALKARSF
jgi:hypothetical protein